MSKIRLPREAACWECLNKYTVGEGKRKEMKGMQIFWLEVHELKKKKGKGLRNPMYIKVIW